MIRSLLLLFCAGVSAGAGAFAQNSLTAVSPDGKLHLHFDVFDPDESETFVRIGYNVAVEGKEVIATSYLGFWIHNQEPILGENVGLSESKQGQRDGCTWLLGEYLQNGSLGRRINVEARVCNGWVAFRYVIPRSTPLDDALVDSEETEFRFAAPVSLPPHAQLPFTTQAGDSLWVAIAESGGDDYPRLSLFREEARAFLADVAIPRTGLPLGREASLTSAWRIIAIGASEKVVSETIQAASRRLN